MSNWKVGPAGQLYDPVTGAYVGHLDEGGAERMVLTATLSDQGNAYFAGGLDVTDELTSGGTGAATGIGEFAGFVPSMLASFTTGATASQSGTTVTVSSPAHGIVGSTAKNGYRIYYPGSASIPAGWYAGFSWVDANTITFQRASATVASEAVNGGAAFTAEVAVSSKTIAANSIGDCGNVSVETVRSGSTTTGNKTVVVKFGGTALSTLGLNSQPNGRFIQSFSNISSTGKQIGFAAQDGSGSNAAVLSASIDTTSDATLSVTMQLFAAQLWMSIDNISVKVAKRASVP